MSNDENVFWDFSANDIVKLVDEMKKKGIYNNKTSFADICKYECERNIKINEEMDLGL